LTQNNDSKLGSSSIDHMTASILTTIPIPEYKEKRLLDNLVSGGVK